MFYRVQAKKMVGIETVDTVIQNSTHEKFLCFTFDSKVNCDKNIKKLCEKARAKLTRISCIKTWTVKKPLGITGKYTSKGHR